MGVFLYALDEHQHIRRGIQNRRRGKLRGSIPVGGGIAHSPGGGPMGLVLQIDADEMRQASVTRGHEGQIGEPLRLGVGRVVPQLGDPAVAVQAVMIEQDIQALPVKFAEHGVQNLQGVLARQIRIQRRIHAADPVTGEGAGTHRNPYRIEADSLDLGNHVLPVARPKAVDDMIPGFKTEPVDAA